MPRYRYRAINEGGEIVKGEITALHEADLQAQLRASGLSLIRFSTVRRRALRLPTGEAHPLRADHRRQAIGHDCQIIFQDRLVECSFKLSICYRQAQEQIVFQ